MGWTPVYTFATSGVGGGNGGINRGADGATWHFSAEDPPPRSLGSERDFCLTKFPKNVYQKRSLFFGMPPAWILVGNLAGGPVGPKGEPGPPGQAGSSGPKGDTGATGAAGTNGTNGTNGTGWTPLDSQTLGAPAATVSFTSISGAYKHLQLVLTGRSDKVATNNTILVRFNSDSGSHYDWQRMQSAATTTDFATALAATSMNAGDVSGASSPAGASGNHEYLIPNYAGTTYRKSLITNGMFQLDNTVVYNQRYVGNWRDTSAITRIDLFFGSDNWDTGSTFTLYGIS